MAFEDLLVSHHPSDRRHFTVGPFLPAGWRPLRLRFSRSSSVEPLVSQKNRASLSLSRGAYNSTCNELANNRLSTKKIDVIKIHTEASKALSWSVLLLDILDIWVAMGFVC
jgi:hypothetical protein